MVPNRTVQAAMRPLPRCYRAYLLERQHMDRSLGKHYFKRGSTRVTKLMRQSLSLFAISAALFLVTAAQAQPPAGTTAVCRDGSYSSAAAKRGACSGHKGVGQWLGNSDATAAKAPSPAPTVASKAPMASPAPIPKAPATMAPAASSGGSGQVWVNTASKVYHCPGDRYYGKTKAGNYMTEASALADGYRADHGKSCH
jgi:hypothetical protein